MPTTLHRPVPAYWHKLKHISQLFGVSPRRYARFGLAGHNGIDYAVPQGTPVLAVDVGIVIWIREDAQGFGLHMKLLHRWGESLYAHLSETMVLPTVHIGRGQPVALTGNTGYSTGPHLHFGYRPFPLAYTNGYYGYADPVSLFDPALA